MELIDPDYTIGNAEGTTTWNGYRYTPYRTNTLTEPVRISLPQDVDPDELLYGQAVIDSWEWVSNAEDRAFHAFQEMSRIFAEDIEAEYNESPEELCELDAFLSEFQITDGGESR